MGYSIFFKNGKTVFKNVSRNFYAPISYVVKHIRLNIGPVSQLVNPSVIGICYPFLDCPHVLDLFLKRKYWIICKIVNISTNFIFFYVLLYGTHKDVNYFQNMEPPAENPYYLSLLQSGLA